jgi:DNA repair protein RecN (Recombination protein N)
LRRVFGHQLLETAEAVDYPLRRTTTPLKRGVNESCPGTRRKLSCALRIGLDFFSLHFSFASGYHSGQIRRERNVAMLTTLRIKNLVLVTDLTIEWPPGLVVITGETGAGKSIILGALDLVLGERADRALMRSGAESCSVEAVFDVSGLRAPLGEFLEANGVEPCESCQLVLKRTFTAAGANRQFINGTPTTLNVLAAVGQWLVDVHGPHEHQSLLHPAKQLAILDAFGNLQERVGAFAGVARRRASLEAEKAALITDEKTYMQQLDLLRFQVGEINAAKLRADEEAGLERDYQRASNAAKLLQLSQAAVSLLSEDENAVLNQAGAVGRLLQEVRRLDADAEPLLALHEQAAATLRELPRELSRYAGQIDLDPGRLQALEERLNLVHSLKRKYGSTLAEVIAFGAAAAQRLQQLEQRDDELNRLNQELQKLEAELWRAGQQLSAQRRQVIPKLAQAVNRHLADLGFKQSHFDVAISTAAQACGGAGPFTATGLDVIEFQFAPNPGEPARPLRGIASSGEMARVMLALKTVLAVEDEVPVLVFDEVDANVGGETAFAVGEKLRQIARQRQVFCITHLAPVAAMTRAHFLVTKETVGGRTVSSVKLLEQKERVTELARMLGGQTEAARRHAATLLEG